MLCEQCQKQEATIHITSIDAGVTIKRDLCNECLLSSDTPEAKCAAEFVDARCDYCGAPASSGGPDPFAVEAGEHRFVHHCFDCSEEFYRWWGGATKRLPKGLSQEQELEALRRLRQEADRHMKDWVSRRAK